MSSSRCSRKPNGTADKKPHSLTRYMQNLLWRLANDTRKFRPICPGSRCSTKLSDTADEKLNPLLATPECPHDTRNPLGVPTYLSRMSSSRCPRSQAMYSRAASVTRGHHERSRQRSLRRFSAINSIPSSVTWATIKYAWLPRGSKTHTHTHTLNRKAQRTIAVSFLCFLGQERGSNS